MFYLIHRNLLELVIAGFKPKFVIFGSVIQFVVDVLHVQMRFVIAALIVLRCVFGFIAVKVTGDAV